VAVVYAVTTPWEARDGTVATEVVDGETRFMGARFTENSIPDGLVAR
jgi:hypothetical protein